MDEDSKKYYKRIVTEIFGPSYDSNIWPEVMFEALEKAEKIIVNWSFEVMIQEEPVSVMVGE